MITAERYHDFSAGHRVVGHEGKCRHLHGHNYRIHFVCRSRSATGVDALGRVIDFGAIKEHLCMWLEENWDHKFIAWNEDRLMRTLAGEMVGNFEVAEDDVNFIDSIVWVDFNPTAEAMAKYLVEEIAPERLVGTGVELIECRIEETRKCSCTYKKEASCLCS